VRRSGGECQGPDHAAIKVAADKLGPLFVCSCCGRFHNGKRYLTEAELEPYARCSRKRRGEQAGVPQL
jgi:hypothetical protein